MFIPTWLIIVLLLCIPGLLDALVGLGILALMMVFIFGTAGIVVYTVFQFWH